MFTGIIQDVGTITSLHWQAEHAQLTIDTNLTNQIHSQVGDSIAVDGICLTIDRELYRFSILLGIAEHVPQQRRWSVRCLRFLINRFNLLRHLHGARNSWQDA